MNYEFISTAESHYKAKMDEAAFTMRLYMKNAVGIGEHPQVFEEFRNALESFQQARDHFNLVQELKAHVVKSQQAEGESQEAEESGDEG